MVGNACIEAGQRLWAQISDALAEKWAVDRSRIEGELGTLYVPDTDLRMSFREAVQLTEAKFGTLGSTGSYRTRKLGGSYRGGTIGASPAYSFTAHVVEEEVDPQTDICGVERVCADIDRRQALNPTLA